MYTSDEAILSLILTTRKKSIFLFFYTMNYLYILVAIVGVVIIGYFLKDFFFEGFENVEEKENDKKMENGKLTVMLFYSNNCGACKYMREEWEKLKKTNLYEIKEIAESDPGSEEIFDKHVITAFPTIRVFRNDKLIYTHPIGKQFLAKEFILMVEEYASLGTNKL